MPGTVVLVTGRGQSTVSVVKAIGFGLLLFGVFSLGLERYRQVRDDDLIDQAKAIGNEVASAVGR